MIIDFKRINHIQICIPRNQEETAKMFYCKLLGLQQIEKPEFLKKNGGFWLRIADIELHIGAEDVENKSKRHPAFEVQRLDQVKRYLQTHDVKIREDKSLPLFNRFSLFDPFNNRIELLEAKTKEELNYLGKEVTIRIDRKLGSKHPKHDLLYELNYGFVPNTMTADGAELDAYVLDKQQPLDQFSGIVKAVIRRYNDVENKLVVCSPDHRPNKAEIREKTRFQEQFFDSEISILES